ncbi:MAG: 4-hydroxy-tetrahydrodipicolinate synthase [candidate division BRC1 bacterium ADurb.BinA292]|nr:MAG: 4-hydroxy-tetrahydrodipicolinate synthase [candidate division BRC1 bacterium ADurb.BinA292]
MQKRPMRNSLAAPQRHDRLSGVIPALPTPLDAHEDVDLNALRRLLDHCVGSGAAAIFLLGSMGEGPNLVNEQKRLAVRAAVRHLDHAVPLLANISETSTRRTLELGRLIQDEQPDYLISTGPFFYHYPNPDSQLEFFARLAEELALPLIFYHQPGMTGNACDVDTIDQIVNMPRVAALKDSSCNFGLIAELLRRYPDRATRPFSLLQGDESLFDITLLLGADGVISGGGTAFIPLLLELYRAASAGDRERAYALNAQFRAALLEMLGPNLKVDWMAAVKDTLKQRDLCENICTSPFVNRFRVLDGHGQTALLRPAAAGRPG